MSDLPGWEWQQDIEHRRWIEEYEAHLKTGNLSQQQTQHTAHTTAISKETNMRISEEFSGSWLKAVDLRGQRVTVIIDGVKKEEIGQGEDREYKPVVYFQGKDKGLVLNKTNGNTIAELHGDDTDNWGGKPVVLYPTKVQFGAKMVDAIRVDTAVASDVATPGVQPAAAPAPAPAPAVAADDFDDDIPF